MIQLLFIDLFLFLFNLRRVEFAIFKKKREKDTKTFKNLAFKFRGGFVQCDQFHSK
jgi:hypothetical protein